MRPIRTKIVGVTHRNSDGSSRQKILKRMQEEYYEGDLLYLEAEPENPYDENAIKVMNAEDEQIGYLNRDLAKDLTKRMDNGEEFSVELLEITGGYDGFALGCNIEIEALKNEKCNDIFVNENSHDTPDIKPIHEIVYSQKEPFVETKVNYDYTQETLHSPEIHTSNATFFSPIQKKIECFIMGFFGIILVLGSLGNAKLFPVMLMIPVTLFLLGYMTATIAKMKRLESTFTKWFLYGMFVPVISWFDVCMQKSNKKSNGFLQGMLMTVFFIFIFVVSASTYKNREKVIQYSPRYVENTTKENQPLQQKKWYQGGTLHKATIMEWKKATESNKLATCADWILAIRDKLKMNIDSEGVLFYYSSELVKFLNEAVYDVKYFDNDKVTNLVTIGVIMMKWVKK